MTFCMSTTGLEPERDGFLERADAQVGVDRGNERRWQLDPSRLIVEKPGSVKVTV